MAQLLRQGTSVAVHVGPALTTGGLAVQTAITTTGTAKRIIKHLATAAVTVTGAITHISVGHYRMTLGTGHTGTLGHLTLAITATAGTNKSLPMWQRYVVVPTNVFDSLVSGGDKLQADAVTVATGQQDAIGARVWATATRALTDKAGFSLVSGQHDSIGARTWQTTIAQVTGAPVTASGTAALKLGFVYVAARNKRITTATGDKIHNSVSVGIAKAPITAGTGTFTRGKYVSVTG